MSFAVVTVAGGGGVGEHDISPAPPGVELPDPGVDG